MLPQLGPMEMALIMGIAVLLFGKRLPEVGKQIGRGVLEFKKGLNGLTEELHEGSSGAGISGYSSSTSQSLGYASNYRYDEKPRGDSAYSDASVPKFEVPGVASSSSTSAGDSPAESVGM
ncbi:Sec-independent protein translocase protein TatA [Aquisphaera giovannonii]|uniref:Sec-independent protein translocase protein TatA n=1 Tax=Aquisphaera giovannonii TaxID=406548 RepID=A0A5B9VXS3_9BACT|nr:twin-arginine translocase TatA/TatE family subunit [Aquisphaera giovannonii]QEH33176.1 Sec-independent protein translocase protein TatA [Aquisphaera giovannonii]